MSDYLVLESESPFGSGGDGCRTAAALVAAGHSVTVFLVQNAVQGARRGAEQNAVANACEAGAKLLADDFSLRERGIAPDRLLPGVAPSPIETVVDRLAAGSKVLWF